LFMYQNKKAKDRTEYPDEREDASEHQDEYEKEAHRPTRSFSVRSRLSTTHRSGSVFSCHRIVEFSLIEPLISAVRTPEASVFLSAAKQSVQARITACMMFCSCWGGAVQSYCSSAPSPRDLAIVMWVQAYCGATSVIYLPKRVPAASRRARHKRKKERRGCGVPFGSEGAVFNLSFP
jgi:hypothetical protein